jgi:hypothetical protein
LELGEVIGRMFASTCSVCEATDGLLAARAVSESEFIIMGGQQRRPFLHVADGAEAVVRCWRRPPGRSRTGCSTSAPTSRATGWSTARPSGSSRCTGSPTGSPWNPGRPRPEYGEVLPAPAYPVAGFFAVAVQSLTHEVPRERPLWTLFGVAAAFGLWGKANRWSLGGST